MWFNITVVLRVFGPLGGPNQNAWHGTKLKHATTSRLGLGGEAILALCVAEKKSDTNHLPGDTVAWCVNQSIWNWTKLKLGNWVLLSAMKRIQLIWLKESFAEGTSKAISTKDFRRLPTKILFLECVYFLSYSFKTFKVFFLYWTEIKFETIVFYLYDELKLKLRHCRFSCRKFEKLWCWSLIAT